MNQDFAPPSAASLDALLKFLGDPKNAAKHIEDMKKVAAGIEKSRAALKKEADEHRAEQDKADRLHGARTDEIVKRENELRRLDGYAAKLDHRERDLIPRETDLSNRILAHEKKEAALLQFDTELQQQDTELRNARAALDKRAEKLAAAERDFNDRMARLRALAG